MGYVVDVECVCFGQAEHGVGHDGDERGDSAPGGRVAGD